MLRQHAEYIIDHIFCSHILKRVYQKHRHNTESKRCTIHWFLRNYITIYTYICIFILCLCINYILKHTILTSKYIIDDHSVVNHDIIVKGLVVYAFFNISASGINGANAIFQHCDDDFVSLYFL